MDDIKSKLDYLTQKTEQSYAYSKLSYILNSITLAVIILKWK